MTNGCLILGVFGQMNRLVKLCLKDIHILKQYILANGQNEEILEKVDKMLEILESIYEPAENEGEEDWI